MLYGGDMLTNLAAIQLGVITTYVAQCQETDPQTHRLFSELARLSSKAMNKLIHALTGNTPGKTAVDITPPKEEKRGDRAEGETEDTPMTGGGAASASAAPLLLPVGGAAPATVPKEEPDPTPKAKQEVGEGGDITPPPPRATGEHQKIFPLSSFRSS